MNDKIPKRFEPQSKSIEKTWFAQNDYVLGKRFTRGSAFDELFPAFTFRQSVGSMSTLASVRQLPDKSRKKPAAVRVTQYICGVRGTRWNGGRERNSPYSCRGVDENRE
ncbi:MAG: hypothetical protein ACLPW4_22985 [Candidatus Sulfotelmatobacter sp.]